jgi:hypothetical protein
MKKEYRIMMNLWLAAAIVVSGAAGVISMGCGGEEKAAAPPPALEQPEKAAPEAAEPAAPAESAEEAAAEEGVPAAVAPVKAAAPAAAAAIRPQTLDVLQLAPATSQIVLAVPPLNPLLAKVLPFIRKVAPELDVDTEMEKFVSDLARDAKVENAETLNDIAVAKGIDLNEPFAIFMNAEASVESVLKEMEEAQEALEKLQAEAAAPEEDAADGDAEAAGIDPEEAEVKFDKMEMPGWALAAGVMEPGEAEKAIQELISSIPDLSGVEAVEVPAGDVTVKAYNEYGYFITENRLALGSLEEVKGVAARLSEPAAVRYGTTDCAPETDDEIVMLLYGGQFLPGLKKMLPALAENDSINAMMQTQMAALETMFAGEGADDPLVTTLGLTDEKLELKSRIDTETHPGILEYSGVPEPFSLTQKLPENTLALITLGFTEEQKKQLTEVYMPAIQQNMGGDPNLSQGMTIANQVISMLGSEITLGVSGLVEDFPGVYLMASFADPDATKGLLQMLVPMMSEETYEEVPISSIAAPSPIPFYICFPGDIALVGNQIDGMKQIIDYVKNDKTTGMFAAQNPPLEPEVPRYNLFMIKSSLLSDVVMPLSMMFGGLPGEAQPIAERVTSNLREIRLVNELRDGWSVQNVTLYLNQGGAAPAGEAPAEEAPAE